MFGQTKRKTSPFIYQSQVSILGPVGYGPTTLPLRHSDLFERLLKQNIFVYIFRRWMFCSYLDAGFALHTNPFSKIENFATLFGLTIEGSVIGISYSSLLE